MGAVLKLRETPEPVTHNGRERLICGWRTDAVGPWLITKKLAEKPVSLGEVAFFAYQHNSQGNRQKVKNNVSALRRWLQDRDEFLLVAYGYQRRIEALKVCNFADENDRHAAGEQLARLVSRGEVTMAEADRWEKKLFLPSSE